MNSDVGEERGFYKLIFRRSELVGPVVVEVSPAEADLAEADLAESPT